MANITVELEVGDIVSLNSGGPDMTVSGIVDDNISCSYFSYGDEDYKRDIFKSDMLSISE